MLDLKKISTYIYIHIGVQKIQDLTSIQNAWAGFFAAFFSSLTLCPTELIKCKLQAIKEIQIESESSISEVSITKIKKKIKINI